MGFIFIFVVSFIVTLLIVRKRINKPVKKTMPNQKDEELITVILPTINNDK